MMKVEFTQKERKSNIKGDLGYYGTDRITVPNKKPKDRTYKEEIDFNKQFSKERIK